MAFPSRPPRGRFVPRKEPEHRINHMIRVPEVRLVGDNVEVGVYPTQKALQIAQELGLDLLHRLDDDAHDDDNKTGVDPTDVEGMLGGFDVTEEYEDEDDNDDDNDGCGDVGGGCGDGDSGGEGDGGGDGCSECDGDGSDDGGCRSNGDGPQWLR